MPQDSHFGTGGRIPQARGAVTRSCDRTYTIWSEGCVDNFPFVPAQDSELFVRSRIPKPGSVIV
jgi:hypothetical protein